MLDSTEIKGAVRLKINHWPKNRWSGKNIARAHVIKNAVLMGFGAWSLFMVHIRFTPSEGPMNHEN